MREGKKGKKGEKCGRRRERRVSTGKGWQGLKKGGKATRMREGEKGGKEVGRQEEQKEKKGWAIDVKH